MLVVPFCLSAGWALTSSTENEINTFIHILIKFKMLNKKAWRKNDFVYICNYIKISMVARIKLVEKLRAQFYLKNQFCETEE